MDDRTQIVAALNRSGFPLQTRVEQEIVARGGGGWRVVASEHPWRDPDGQDQFTDLIAACGEVVLVIECKKAEDRTLTFLRPLGQDDTGAVRDVNCWELQQNQGAGKPFGARLRDIGLDPASYCAAFCVTSDKGAQRLLEQDARGAVLAADALAERLGAIPLPVRSFLVPTIVTTTPLYTLRYDPREIALESGTFTNLDVNFLEPIPWIRFHKSLTSRSGSHPRTVFVVHAAALPRFLDETSRGQGMGP
jgi:hypothetical protein